MTSKSHFIILSALSLLFMLISCKKETVNKNENKGTVSFYFQHNVNDQNLVVDELNYINKAGNQYLVNEIQYFISNVILYKNDGKQFKFETIDDIHYVDTDLPETWNFTLRDSIPAGNYDSISFVFGITEELNNSLMFVNPPESNMFWPDYLGGGYHYMKLNGKWKLDDESLMPFNLHLGIGQIYDINTNEITGFVQNFFTVHLKNSAFTINQNEMVYFDLIMNIDKWFKEPNTYDFNYWGGHIMQNQAAMQAIVENGHNVFTLQRMIID